MQAEKLGSGTGRVKREAERTTDMTIVILQEKDEKLGPDRLAQKWRKLRDWRFFLEMDLGGSAYELTEVNERQKYGRQKSREKVFGFPAVWHLESESYHKKWRTIFQKELGVLVKHPGGDVNEAVGWAQVYEEESEVGEK